MRADQQPRRFQLGVTLVELMVSLVLSMILLGSVGYVFVSSRSTGRANDGLSLLQENARTAFDVLTQDIRQAAYRGCAGSTGTLINTLNTSVSPSSLWDFGAPIKGYVDVSAVPDNSLVVPSAKASSPILMVRVVEDGGGLIVEHGAKTDSPKIPLGSQVATGDIVMAANCQASAVFQVTGVSTGNDAAGVQRSVIAHAASAGKPGNATNNLERPFENGELRRLRTKFYYLRTSAANPDLTALYVGNSRDLSASGSISGAELVTGVESMAIEYGILSAGAVSSYVTANNVSAADWNNIGAVRITLVLVSEQSNVAVASSATSASSSSASSSAKSKRLRQTFRTTISIRNLVS